MATALDECVGQYQVAAVRAVRLDATCAPVAGTNNVIATSALITLSASPEIEEGDEFEPKGASGQICWSVKDCDRIKRWNLDGEFCTFDYELIEMMTGASLLTGAAMGTYDMKTTGIAHSGLNAACPNGVQLEVWTRTAVGTGTCGAGSAFAPYVRHLFPKVIITPGDSTFENDAMTFAFTGRSEPNSEWTDLNTDWPALELPSALDSGYLQAWDEAIPTLACGYTDVP